MLEYRRVVKELEVGDVVHRKKPTEENCEIIDIESGIYHFKGFACTKDALLWLCKDGKGIAKKDDKKIVSTFHKPYQKESKKQAGLQGC
jgi:hypothetical protein